jgi:hypothetical protein
MSTKTKAPAAVHRTVEVTAPPKRAMRPYRKPDKVEDLVADYLRLRRLLGRAEARAEEVGEILKAEILERGVRNENGTARLQVGDLVAQAVRQVRRSCDEEAVREFSAGHPELTVTKEVGDKNLIEELWQAGKLTPEDHDAMVRATESYSLRVGPGSAR